jgi:hypothetical protein
MPTVPREKLVQELSTYRTTEATRLGQLILGLNPYTNKNNKDTEQSTGELELYADETRQPTLSDPPIANVGVETDGPYRQEWTFKGQPQKVGMAARIKYRYPVRDERGGTLFWVDDYLLIGFQGSMGG